MRRSACGSPAAPTRRCAAGRERRQQRRLPRPHGPLARRPARPGRQQRGRSSSTCTASCRRDAVELAGRGAEGAGRRGALVRAAQPPAGRAVRRVRRRALAGLPRRAGRDRRHQRGRARHARARVVIAGGEIAQTFFFSTSGGRTAGNEEAFGGSPDLLPAPGRRPARRPLAVPHWTARLHHARRREAAAGGHVRRPRGLRVATRTPSGRAATVIVRGSGGDQTASAATIRTPARAAQHLDLRSPGRSPVSAARWTNPGIVRYRQSSDGRRVLNARHTMNALRGARAWVLVRHADQRRPDLADGTP